MLDGECKIEFEKWYLKKHKKEFSINYLKMIIGFFLSGHNAHLHAFNCSPSEMQYGVEVDFLDSVDILVSIELHFVGDPRYDSDAGYRFEVCIDEDTYSMYRTRQEARSAAITKANELFNLRRESK